MKRAASIVIRRCLLRVARRGGWSWGADARSLVQRAVERLPALLERRLVEIDSALPGDIEIREPLQLRVPVSARQWRELTAVHTPSAALVAELESAAGAALARALPAMTDADGCTDELVDATSTEPGRRAAATPSATTRQPGISNGSSLWTLLAGWRAEGALSARIATLDADILSLWIERLLQLEPAGAGAAIDAARASAIWRDVCAQPILLPPGPARTLAQRVLFLVEIRAGGGLPTAALREVFARACGAPDVDIERLHEARGDAASRSRAGAPDGAPTPRAQGHVAVPSILASTAGDVFELDIPCALPFLLLTPLSRAGYLTTVAAALESAHAVDLAAGFALGLAHKCLASPQRGWLRDAGTLAAAAAFAGREISDGELVSGAGRALRSQLPLLDDCIGRQLLAGHRAGAAWLVVRHSPQRWVLLDEDGLAPVATGSCADLAPRIAPSGAVLFLPAPLATSEHLDLLDDLQIPYASDADLSARAGCTRCIARDGGRYWVSAHGAQQGRARGIAERGAALAEAALANWQQLHDARPAQRPGVDPGFEVTLSLAAGFGLSAIAWLLWQRRGSATAQVALDIFADLDARVRVTPERVHVVLPMGRRAWDLRDHGLLADVRDVPWLGDRVVTFGVG